MIKGQFSGKHSDSVGDRYLSSFKVYGFDAAVEDRYTPEQFAKRIADVGRFEIA
jgi:hypothetical protein